MQKILQYTSMSAIACTLLLGKSSTNTTHKSTKNKGTITNTYTLFAHAGVPFVLSLFHNDGWAWMWSTYRVITRGPLEVLNSPTPTGKWAPQWNKVTPSNGNDEGRTHRQRCKHIKHQDEQMQAHLSASNTICTALSLSYNQTQWDTNMNRELNACSRLYCRQVRNNNNQCQWLKNTPYQNINVWVHQINEKVSYQQTTLCHWFDLKQSFSSLLSLF